MEIRLVYNDNDDAFGSVLWERDGGDLLVGRDRSCAIRTTHRSVSRLHCSFRWVGAAVHVVDLGSVNGTFVNGHRIQQATLQAGDVVRCGSGLTIWGLMEQSAALSNGSHLVFSMDQAILRRCARSISVGRLMGFLPAGVFREARMMWVPALFGERAKRSIWVPLSVSKPTELPGVCLQAAPLPSLQSLHVWVVGRLFRAEIDCIFVHIVCFFGSHGEVGCVLTRHNGQVASVEFPVRLDEHGAALVQLGPLQRGSYTFEVRTQTLPEHVDALAFEVVEDGPQLLAARVVRASVDGAECRLSVAVESLLGPCQDDLLWVAQDDAGQTLERGRVSAQPWVESFEISVPFDCARLRIRLDTAEPLEVCLPLVLNPPPVSVPLSNMRGGSLLHMDPARSYQRSLVRSFARSSGAVLCSPSDERAPWTLEVDAPIRTLHTHCFDAREHSAPVHHETYTDLHPDEPIEVPPLRPYALWLYCAERHNGSLEQGWSLNWRDAAPRLVLKGEGVWSCVEDLSLEVETAPYASVFVSFSTVHPSISSAEDRLERAMQSSLRRVAKHLKQTPSVPSLQQLLIQLQAPIQPTSRTHPPRLDRRSPVPSKDNPHAHPAESLGQTLRVAGWQTTALHTADAQGRVSLSCPAVPSYVTPAHTLYARVVALSEMSATTQVHTFHPSPDSPKEAPRIEPRFAWGSVWALRTRPVPNAVQVTAETALRSLLQTLSRQPTDTVHTVCLRILVDAVSLELDPCEHRRGDVLARWVAYTLHLGSLNPLEDHAEPLALLLALSTLHLPRLTLRGESMISTFIEYAHRAHAPSLWDLTESDEDEFDVEPFSRTAALLIQNTTRLRRDPHAHLPWDFPDAHPTHNPTAWLLALLECVRAERDYERDVLTLWSHTQPRPYAPNPTTFVCSIQTLPKHHGAHALSLVIQANLPYTGVRARLYVVLSSGLSFPQTRSTTHTLVWCNPTTFELDLLRTHHTEAALATLDVYWIPDEPTQPSHHIRLHVP